MTAPVPQETVSVFEFHFYLLGGLLGTVLNCFVLFLALRYVDTHDKPRQIIVINMTFADLLTCTIYMLTRPFLNQFQTPMCYPYYVVIFSSQIASCAFLLCINLDKLLFIMYPLHYYQLVTRKRVLTLVSCVWTFLVTLGVMAYIDLHVANPCNVVFINPYIYLSIIILYVLVISSSFVISTVIYYIAHKSQRSENAQNRKAFKRMFFVFSSTLWTFCTCLPYRVCFLISAIFIPCHDRARAASAFCTLTGLFFFLIVVGIVLNPLITVLTQRMYRQHLLRLLPCLGQRAKGLRPDSRAVRFRSGSAEPGEGIRLADGADPGHI